MCGICGELRFDGRAPEPSVVVAMRDQLTHRGPDEDGLYVSPSGSAALGFRRLRIIDLTPNASQPLANEDGSVRVVLNGEIYNFQELRRGLLARGHRFKSQSDTEVIVHLYEEKGAGLVADLDGMFAIAIWDERARRLTIARDRVGKKPTADDDKRWGIDKLNVVRSEIPAATHVDYSARIQTVRRETNPLYYDIIDAFYRLTGCPVIVNTSFNVKDEPIVCTPEDAYRCFMKTNMDVLVMEDFVFVKPAAAETPVPEAVTVAAR